MIQNLSSAQLHKAAKLKSKIDALQAKLDGLLGSKGSTGGIEKKAKRKLSPAARQRIVDAQKARWAKFNAGKK